MKRAFAGIISVCLVCLSTSGEAARLWLSDPEIRIVETSIYDAQLQPLKNENNIFVAFMITIVNKTDEDLVIDWNRSRYIHDDRGRGSFVFEGIEPEAIRNETVPPDIIPTKGRLSKRIAPFRLIAFAPLGNPGVGIATKGISAGRIPAGENGIFLVARQGDREFRKKITVQLSVTTKP